MHVAASNCGSCDALAGALHSVPVTPSPESWYPSAQRYWHRVSVDPWQVVLPPAPFVFEMSKSAQAFAVHTAGPPEVEVKLGEPDSRAGAWHVTLPPPVYPGSQVKLQAWSPTAPVQPLGLFLLLFGISYVSQPLGLHEPDVKLGD